MAQTTFDQPTVGAAIHAESGTWNGAHDASAGNEGGDSGLTNNEVIAKVEAPSGDWGYKIRRGFMVWDTSSLPNDCAIISAKIRLYMVAKVDSISGDTYLVITGNSQASNTAAVDEDYDQLDTADHGKKLLSNFTSGAWNEISLDASGIAQISKTGYTKFGLRNNRDRADNPPGLNSGDEYAAFDGENNTNEPELVVEYAEEPTVTTGSIENIRMSACKANGNVTDDGGGTVSERGFVWDTSPSPTTSDNKKQVGSGTGSFSTTIDTLTTGKVYYLRSYCINQWGTTYGAQVKFATFLGGAVV